MKELNIKLTIKELNLILEALGTQSYIRVYQLIDEIQNQAQEQLKGSATNLSLNAENGHHEAKPSAEVVSN